MSDSTPQPPRDAQADLQLQAMFDGKRASERFPCHVTALLDGTRGSAHSVSGPLAMRWAMRAASEPGGRRSRACCASKPVSVPAASGPQAAWAAWNTRPPRRAPAAGTCVGAGGRGARAAGAGGWSGTSEAPLQRLATSLGASGARKRTPTRAASPPAKPAMKRTASQGTRRRRCGMLSSRPRAACSWSSA